VEPMIRHSVKALFNKQFWLNSTGKSELFQQCRRLLGPYTGTIMDISLVKGLPPQVKILVDVLSTRVNRKSSHIMDISLVKGLPPQVKILMDVLSTRVNRKSSHFLTKVLISQDLTVDCTKPMHRNCLREAIMDTYPRAHSDLTYTIQDLIDNSIERDQRDGPEDKAATEDS
jgi:hypothetical protein